MIHKEGGGSSHGGKTPRGDHMYRIFADASCPSYLTKHHHPGSLPNGEGCSALSRCTMPVGLQPGV